MISEERIVELRRTTRANDYAPFADAIAFARAVEREATAELRADNSRRAYEAAERAEAERDALRALLRRVLSCGLNEDPPGSGFTPSRQERIAGELARDISDALAGGKP